MAYNCIQCTMQPLLDNSRNCMSRFFPLTVANELLKKSFGIQLTSSIDRSLKDAPLGVRLMGMMAGSIAARVASGIADSMAEQSRLMDDLLDEAKGYIMFDPLATDELGEPITVGRPFNQSSSTSIINGVKAQNIQASFEVLGTRKRGLATMVADGDGVQRLRLDVAGRWRVR